MKPYLLGWEQIVFMANKEDDKDYLPTLNLRWETCCKWRTHDNKSLVEGLGPWIQFQITQHGGVLEAWAWGGGIDRRERLWGVGVRAPEVSYQIPSLHQPSGRRSRCRML